ncbi:MAG: trypsin-like peptidase domain-containing protein [Syntrophobacteraceae bacterium]
MWLKGRIPLYFTLLLLLSFADGADGIVADPSLQRLQQDFNRAVAAVRPSVVSIRAEKKMKTGQDNTSLLYESIGSGFIVDERGYVLTNQHVVEDSGNIVVSLWRSKGNTDYSARIVDADPSLDLALLKLDSNERFISAKMGNSDRIRMGDWVLSVGSPFGFEHTVTLGIVSDVHRDLVINSVPYIGMIQTDAVINQGNSGGPLLDIYGNVVAVGTAIYAPNGTSTGVAFAIPIKRAMHFYTLTTGAMTAAAIAPADPPAARAKEALNLNDRMPKDAAHKEFADCTECHCIAKKSMVNIQVPMPHPMVGSCDVCHIMVNEPVAHGPTPVAALVEKPQAGGRTVGPGSFSKVFAFGTLAALVVSALFTVFSLRGRLRVPGTAQSCLLRFLFAFVVSMVGVCTVVGVFFG